MDIDQQSVIPDAVTPDAPSIKIDPSSVVIDPPSATPVPPPAHQDPALQAQWASAGALDRIKMMLPWLKTKGGTALWNETPARPIVDMALTGAGAALGAAGGEVVAGPPGLIAGGMGGAAAGNAMGQKIDMWMGGRDKMSGGEMAGAAALGLFPAASMVEATIPQIAKQGAKMAAGSVAGKIAQTTIDENRMPTVGEYAIAAGSGAIAAPLSSLLDTNTASAEIKAAKALQSVRDETLRDARAAGYVIPSSEVNPSKINIKMESHGGKAAVKQQASINNQEVTNELAKKAIGIPTDEPITPTAINAVRDQAGKVYEQVANLSPDGAKMLRDLQKAREDSSLLWARVKQGTGGIEERDAARALDVEKEKLETSLDALATSSGKPKLIDNLRDARATIAKTYVVENALNASNGNVVAADIAKLFGPKTPLTDELALIGRFASGPGAKFTQEPSLVPSPGVGKTNLLRDIALPGLGAVFGGVPGAVAGGILANSDSLARNAVLSRAWQNSRMGAPNYGTAMPDMASNIARFATQNAGIQPQQQAGPTPAVMQFLRP